MDETNQRLTEPEETRPNIGGRTAHISYFLLPRTLFENPKGPAINRLGLPVGVYNADDQYNRTDVGLAEVNTARSLVSVVMDTLA